MHIIPQLDHLVNRFSEFCFSFFCISVNRHQFPHNLHILPETFWIIHTNPLSFSIFCTRYIGKYYKYRNADRERGGKGGGNSAAKVDISSVLFLDIGFFRNRRRFASMLNDVFAAHPCASITSVLTEHKKYLTFSA